MKILQNKKKFFISSLIFLFGPNIVFAQGVISLIDSGFSIITSILIPLAYALCLLYFFWGVAKYIKGGASSDKAVEEGKKVMIWGIVGLFVATSVWGIVEFIRNELGIKEIINASVQTKK